jgi:hypothetical protein
MRSLFQYAGYAALACFLSLSLSSCSQPQSSSPGYGPGYGFNSQNPYPPGPQRINDRRWNDGRWKDGRWNDGRWNDGRWNDRSWNYSAPGFVHIYQRDGGFGRAKIYLDGEPIAQLREKRYFVIQVKPGLHRFNVSKPDQGELVLNVGRGRHYYVKNSESFGGGKEKLRLMSVESANYEIARMKMLEGKDIIVYQHFVEPAMSSSAWR